MTLNYGITSVMQAKYEAPENLLEALPKALVIPSMTQHQSALIRYKGKDKGFPLPAILHTA